MAVVAAKGIDAHAELLALEGVAKTFPNGTRALSGVDLTVASGQIHGVVGANGAGKSTLIKIMSGALAPTAGRLSWRGREHIWRGPAEALKAGIATVHQHTPLVPTLSVLENVFLANHASWRWRAADRERDLAGLFDLVGYSLAPETPVGELSIGDRQMVAILQAMSQNPALLILDEPTASLSVTERELVHATMRRLRESGTGVVFVSHLLDEVVTLTDAVTVLRDGRVTLAEPTAGLSQDRLVSAIIGRELAASEQAGNRRSSDSARRRPLLTVRHLVSPGKVAGVDLEVGEGEVVGLAGLLGSGRSEILHAIYGSDTSARGRVSVAGAPVSRRPAATVRAGMALVPEDRNRQGLIPRWEIWRNITLPSLRRHSWRGVFPSQTSEWQRADDMVTQLSIIPPVPDALVDELSGGNAQKTVFAKWLHEGIRVLLLDEPTAGIDIGAKRDIQLLIRRLADHGACVVVVDSEFDELLAVADRVLVVRRGRIVAERLAGETTEDELLALASGLAA